VKVLRTLKGSKIERYRGVVGKRMGFWVYVHRDYVSKLPLELKVRVRMARELAEGFEYNCLKISTDSNVVVFMHSQDFDTAAEPVAGKWCRVDMDDLTVKHGDTGNIWHHKWLWVMDDYAGFDVDAAFLRSQVWLALDDVEMARIGNPKYWATVEERIACI
jgi:hypothetical protein